MIREGQVRQSVQGDSTSGHSSGLCSVDSFGAAHAGVCVGTGYLSVSVHYVLCGHGVPVGAVATLLLGAASAVRFRTR